MKRQHESERAQLVTNLAAACYAWLMVYGCSTSRDWEIEEAETKLFTVWSRFAKHVMKYGWDNMLKNAIRQGIESRKKHKEERRGRAKRVEADEKGKENSGEATAGAKDC